MPTTHPTCFAQNVTIKHCGGIIEHSRDGIIEHNVTANFLENRVLQNPLMSECSTLNVYRIAGNIGGELNLADWRI